MEMYNVHQNALLLPLTITSKDYTFGEKKIQAVSGSASRDKNGLVHISLVNIDSRNEQEINIDLGNLSGKTVTGRILRSEKIQDHNTFDNPEKVKPTAFNNAKLSGSSLSLKVPPFSVVVLELK
jgi:alpha-N-arabinofuranosidase